MSMPPPVVPKPEAAPTMHELLQRERALEKELKKLRDRLAKMALTGAPDSQMLRALEKDDNLPVEEDIAEAADYNSRFVSTKPLEEDSPLPTILLRPLSLQDPLRNKWGLGLGLPSVAKARRMGSKSSAALHAAQLGPQAQEVTVKGYLRIFGLLPSGVPCQCKVPLSTVANQGKMVIGRDPTVAHIVIPEIGVSRAHAILEYIDNQLVITDNDSTNGLYVNDHRLSPYEQRVPLYDGSTVNFGETSLRVEIVQ